VGLAPCAGRAGEARGETGRDARRIGGREGPDVTRRDREEGLVEVPWG